jgi:hypothetical protein
MARTTFSGPVRSLNGFLGTGPNMAASITGTVDGGTDIAGIDLYQGKIIQVGNANTVFNLPSIIDTADGASAGGDDPSNLNRVGIKYHFILTASLTGGNTFVLNAGTAAGRATADVFAGMAIYNNTATDPGAVTAFNGSSTDTLTLTATTKGGLAGAQIECQAVDGLLWQISAQLIGNGAFANPWS